MTGTPALAKALKALKTWLVRDAYPLWARVGPDPAGGWHDLIDLDGRPIPGPQRCRVQARQAFVFAVAPRLGWTGEWRGPMRHGLAALQSRHRRAGGLYRAWSGPGAGPRSDDEAELYDQAFVLFALAHAHRAGETDADAAAEALLARLAPHPRGGFRELTGDRLEANPNMHLFEAFLAWSEAGGGSVWASLADRQAELAANALIDPESGAVVEHFGRDWTLPADPQARVVDPGHQFEWAWLLMRWSLIAGRGQDLRAALGLIEVGERAGVDAERGVAIMELDGDLAPTDRTARVWPQTERLKANALAGQITGDPGCWAAAEAAAAALLRYLNAPTPGLWRERMDEGGAFSNEPAPASTLYHIVLAILELDRVLTG